MKLNKKPMTIPTIILHSIDILIKAHNDERCPIEFKNNVYNELVNIKKEAKRVNRGIYSVITYCSLKYILWFLLAVAMAINGLNILFAICVYFIFFLLFKFIISTKTNIVDNEIENLTKRYAILFEDITVVDEIIKIVDAKDFNESLIKMNRAVFKKINE